MKYVRPIHSLAVRLIQLFMLAAPVFPAWAQADPPARVARLNVAEGPVSAAPAGDEEWTDAELNRPLSRGDRLWTDRGSRADVQVGSSSVRMDGQTRLEILALDDQSAQLSLTQGTVYVRVRTLPEGENFEIDTPNLAYRAAYPGDYRIDVDPTRGTTRVTIHSGTGAVYGETGQTQALGGGQQVTFRGRALAQVAAQESPPQDNFDRWAAERNRREDQSVTARRVPRELVGYQHLDTHGQWSRDATYGDVWFPQATPANWAPYRQGRWEWIAPWGWTWIDDAPWGFAPFHYGRWAMIGSRWAWVPGRIGLRPVYAPALTAFVGGNSGGVNWANLLGGGRPAVAWFPLGPGEPWQPGYRASTGYLANINQNIPLAAATYAYQRKPEALTAIPAEDFHRGRPVRGGWLRVAGHVLTNAQVVAPPAMPDRTAVANRERPAPARAGAVPQPDLRAVATGAPNAQQSTRATEQARALEQAKSAEQARLAQQAEQARLQQQKAAAEAAAAQVRQEQQRVAAEQARAASLTKAAEKAQVARGAEQARAERARASEQVRLAEAARREARAEELRVAQRDKAAAHASAGQGKTGRDASARTMPAAASPVPTARAAVTSRPTATARASESARRAEPGRRTPAMARAELAQQRREQTAAQQVARREAVARRAEQARAQATARQEERLRQQAHAQQVEQARRAADRDAQALREQRAQREELARRAAAQEREVAQREAWQRQQQAISDQWRRDHQAWEEQQQRSRGRQRPDLRGTERAAPAEVWQRGIPILNQGPTS